MAYVLQAVIAGDELLRDALRDLPAAKVAPLSQGLSLAPMTSALFDAVADGTDVDHLGFWRLPGGFDRLLADRSTAGPLAYVEAEYFGGVGEQHAAVWAGGAIVLGPLHVQEGQPTPPAGSPISQALRRLGLLTIGAEDEFSAAGLVRHRHSGGWIA
ncbi:MULTISPECIES: hypothetical protein [unclassified Streptomyces]|uniref:hypothetical protein n=1 Tax=unclassified Streptomyces TaxID=2593676 RepID=UPI002E164E88|nr:hypothetical protein OG457_21305 [Streptomyces sp. NBC_01207]WTA19509.1 hypothetical protein OG365_16290 [Streptomyces sp. NBC_00853]